jgi:flagellar FliL protein
MPGESKELRKGVQRLMADAAEETKEPVKAKSSMMKWIIIAVIVLALGGGGFFGYMKFFAAHGEEAAHKEPVVQPVIQDMETFLVNLSDPGGKRYLKVTMKAKLSGPQVAAEFGARVPELRDIILTLLSSKEFADIAQPEDKANLKQELLTQLNKVLKQGQVQDIYFTDFLVQ